MTDGDLKQMLMGRVWIGCPARTDQLTDRLAFDIDCKRPSGLPDRDRRYGALRELLGDTNLPLVYQTPSGAGLRVVYAIPETRLDRFVAGAREGALARALRSGGLEVAQGAVEIFPQQRQIDRLPLGRRMPLLDPRTLLPLDDAAIGETYDPVALEGALERIEQWLVSPCADLPGRIESLAEGQAVEGAARVPDVRAWKRVNGAVRPSAAVVQLVQAGLTEYHSRYRSEWLVGLAILLAPDLFREIGHADPDDDRSVAETLAKWLAKRNNGYSEEWRRSESLRGSRLQFWIDRYLERTSGTGEHLVDRLRHVVERLDPVQRRTFLLSDAERWHQMSIAEKTARGPALFRAEAWLVACQRSIKQTIDFRLRTSRTLRFFERDGERWVSLPIAARWMERFPFGKGRAGAGYTRYRAMLLKAGEMVLARESPTKFAYAAGMRPPNDLAFEAAEYDVKQPDLNVRSRDIRIDPCVLAAAVASVRPRMSGRHVCVDLAHHIIALQRSAVPLRARYGNRRLAARIANIANELEEWMAQAGGP